MEKIQLFRPKFRTDECLEEIRQCLDIGWTGLGFKTIEFENKWKDYTGLPNAHFLNSSTTGLNLAVEILKEKYKWSDNDEIITPPLTFVSTNHAILHSNLKPIFADVDEYLCLDPNDVEKKITHKTKAIIFVGIGGNTGQYKEIENIAKKNGLKLILDAAHMAGTRFDNGELPGKDADVVVYSFQAVKNCPTGDSGMICFKESELDSIVRKKAWLGINKDTYSRKSNNGTYKWMYDVEYVGYKSHGNSIMASVGLVSLKYLDVDNEYRRNIAKLYDKKLTNLTNLSFVKMASDCVSSRHLYQIIVPKRDELLEYLNKNDIYPGVHYRDNTEYQMYKYANGTCPKSLYYSEHVISLPLHLYITEKEVEYISGKIKDFYYKE